MSASPRATFRTTVWGGAFAAIGILGTTLLACSDDIEKPSSNKGALAYAGDSGAFVCPIPVGDSFQRFPWHASKPLHGRACTDVQAQLAARCYLSNEESRTAACQQFVQDPQNGPCLTCAISAPDDPAHGPIVYSQQQGLGVLNFSGCVAGLTNDSTGAGCGGAYAQAQQCVSASCECASDKYFPGCVLAARQTTCAKYMQVASCAAQALPACEGTGPTYFLSQGAYIPRAIELVRLFCGL